MPIEPANDIASSEATSLADNVSTLLKRDGVSESDLARALGLPYNTIKRITAGDTLDPKVSTLQMIASYFDVTLDALMKGNGLQVEQSAASSISKCIPVLSWDDITNPAIVDNITKHAWTKWQPILSSASEPLSQDSYALESRKSMLPRFPLGTILVVDPHEKPMDGDVVLVRILQTNEVTVRDLLIDPPSWQLQAINNNFPAISFDTKAHKVVGVVVLTMLSARS